MPLTAPAGGEEIAVVLVGTPEAGERIDRLLALRLPHLSRSRVKSLIEDRRLEADGITIDNPATRVKPGWSLRLTLPAAVEDQPAAQEIPLDIRYEDAALIVIDKPAGMVVHPAPGNYDATLVNALLAHCGDSLAGIGGVKRPGIVHRLDKDTSGLMVAAKTEHAHHVLSEAFAARTVERAYHAVVWGVPAPRSGEIDLPIGRSPRNRQKMAVVTNGRTAQTGYRVLRPLGLSAALVECRLKTGRTHQIRVHMTETGHPLIGDPLYGGGARPRRLAQLPPEAALVVAGFRRQALHAFLLGFKHPETGEHLRFESQSPADLAGLIEILERV